MRYVSLLLQLSRQTPKLSLNGLAEFFRSLPQQAATFLQKIKSIGHTEYLTDQEKSKLAIFNHLNFFQLITGLTVPLIGLVEASRFPASGWFVVCLPALLYYIYEQWLPSLLLL